MRGPMLTISMKLVPAFDLGRLIQDPPSASGLSMDGNLGVALYLISGIEDG
jgi:hypothetical protein